jgi:DNA-binding transcriptional LysR family regulator
MDLLGAMRGLVRVVETGSFSAAARDLGMTQPAVSKQVAWLEARLGSRLIERSTRKLAFTGEALQYYEKARAVLDAVDDAEGGIRRGTSEVSGTLRVGCSVGFGRAQVVPRLQALLARHPQLRIDLRMSDGFVDLVEEGLDVAIRIGEIGDAAFVARRLGITHRVVVVAPAYLKGRRPPRTPADLADHECVVYSGLATPNEWRFEGNAGPQVVRVRGRLEINSSEGVREAVLAGMGVGFLPVWLIGPDLQRKALQALLADYRAATLPIHGISPPSRRWSAKVKALLDHLETEFSVDPFVSGYGQSA